MPRSAAILSILAWGAPAAAQGLQVADNAPSSYTVQKGDTLWGIAGKFLKEPWRWPEVWRMNREQIRNPHRIYPGDVINLSMVDGRPQLALVAQHGKTFAGGPSFAAPTSGHPCHPARRHRAVPDAARSSPVPPVLPDAAEIVAGRDERVVRGQTDIVYAVGLDAKAGDLWFVYRPGRAPGQRRRGNARL